MGSISPRQRELLARTWVDFMPMQRFADAPLIIDRADGIYYWDIDGNRYLDAIGGVFVASLGHRHPRVLAAVRRQMERVTLAPPMHGVTDVTLDLVDKLGAVTPGDLDFVKTFSGGSEANEAALKLARQYWKQSGHPGKYKVISRYLGYHGGTFGAMAASGTGPRKSKFEPQMGGWGATSARNGLDCMFSSSHGDTYNCPAEICEARYGIEVGWKRLNLADKGQGRHSGGAGLSTCYRPRSRVVVAAGYSHSRKRVWGSNGGGPGGTNSLSVKRRNGHLERHAFVSDLEVDLGDEIIIETATGGGWGQKASGTAEMGDLGE